VLVRRLLPGDADSLAQNCLPQMPLDEVREIVAEDLIEQERGSGLTLVAEAHGQIAATLKMTRQGPEAWLHNVSAASAFRGRGLVPRMIGLLADHLRRTGAARLSAHVRADNRAARRAYEKAGMRCAAADGMRGEQLRYVLDLAPDGEAAQPGEPGQ